MKVRLHKTVVQPMITYGSETSQDGIKPRKISETNEMQILYKMCQKSIPHMQKRIMTNLNIDEIGD